MQPYLFYIIQFVAIQFAISQALHNAPAVDQIENYGATNLQIARFHRYNNWSKFFFCCIAAFCLYPEFIRMAIGGLVSAFWIWLLFDPVLNVSRSYRRKWYYLGLNDGDGRRWINWFGKNAGKWKAAILFLLILSINVLWLIFLKHTQS